MDATIVTTEKVAILPHHPIHQSHDLAGSPLLMAVWRDLTQGNMAPTNNVINSISPHTGHEEAKIPVKLPAKIETNGGTK